MARFLLPLFCLLVASGVWGKPAQLNEKFTTNLMKSLATKGKNVVFSPVSMETALGAVGFGAKGKTMEDLFTTLGYNPAQAKLIFAEKQQLLNEVPAPGAEWQSADRIMSSPDYPLKQSYLTEVKKDFPGVEVGNYDFSDPTKTANDVNAWVADKTHQVIKKLVEPSSVGPNTKTIILNAVYFKGEWKHGFNKNKTRSDCFFTEANQCTSTDMMFNEAFFKYGYHYGMKAEVIELPYKNEQYSMVVVLPDESSDLMTLMSNLNVDDIVEFIEGKKTVKVDVVIPKFEIEFDQEMKNVLSSMGMGSLFSENADLSGMYVKQGPTIDSVIHKAKITCDEDGTVAAAATMVHNGMLSSGSYTEEFEATRPFMYMIRNKQTGILFSGTYSVPKKN